MRAFTQELRLLDGRAFQYQSKLVSAIAKDRGFPEVVAQHTCKFRQAKVSRLMSVDIVDRLEVIDIRNAEHQRLRRRVLLQETHLVMESLTVICARELVK